MNGVLGWKTSHLAIQFCSDVLYVAYYPEGILYRDSKTFLLNFQCLIDWFNLEYLSFIKHWQPTDSSNFWLRNVIDRFGFKDSTGACTNAQLFHFSFNNLKPDIKTNCDSLAEDWVFESQLQHTLVVKTGSDRITAKRSSICVCHIFS